MKTKISDKAVLQLLTTLKDSHNNYPQDMLESRRDMFTKQAAAMAILMKAGVNGANATGTGQTTTASTALSGATTTAGVSIGAILETVLVIAIVAEAGVAAYAYREKIAEFINSTFGPKVEQAANPSDNSSIDFIASDEPASSRTLDETPTVTETPPPPGFTPPVQADNQDSNGSGDSQVASTPDPNDDNGLHLGQTKQPTNEPKKYDSNDSNNKNKNK